MRFTDTKYFGIKLSPNRITNDKGQLIVLGCIFARTGKQKYHKSELGIHGEDGFIEIDRPESEVSSPATIASFEGSPLTYDHPQDDVKVGLNWDELSKGMAFNIKYVKSPNGGGGYLTADLIFTDARLIEDIKNGRIQELSAGYNCEVDENTWTQRKIRGNHIAVVQNARAGSVARIRDNAFENTKSKTIKVGDKEFFITDSYTYEVENEEGTMETYTDYYSENDEGVEVVVKTIRDSYFEREQIDPPEDTKYEEQLELLGRLASHLEDEYDIEFAHDEDKDEYIFEGDSDYEITEEDMEFIGTLYDEAQSWIRYNDDNGVIKVCKYDDGITIKLF